MTPHVTPCLKYHTDSKYLNHIGILGSGEKSLVANDKYPYEGTVIHQILGWVFPWCWPMFQALNAVVWYWTLLAPWEPIFISSSPCWFFPCRWCLINTQCLSNWPSIVKAFPNNFLRILSFPTESQMRLNHRCKATQTGNGRNHLTYFKLGEKAFLKENPFQIACLISLKPI